MSDANKLTFTLKGVHPSEIADEVKMPKFVPKTSKSANNPKIKTRVDQSGQNIVIAYSGNVKFSHEEDLQPENMNCYWCHHGYDTPLICIPNKCTIKDRRYHFYGTGSFCSMFCLYAYLRDLENHKDYCQPQWLSTARQLTIVAFAAMYPPEVKLVPAPHWQMLDVYGGPLTIQEFRKASCNKNYILTPNITFNQGALTFVA